MACGVELAGWRERKREEKLTEEGVGVSLEEKDKEGNGEGMRIYRNQMMRS